MLESVWALSPHCRTQVLFPLFHKGVEVRCDWLKGAQDVSQLQKILFLSAVCP